MRSAQYSIGLSYSSHVFFLWDSLYGVGSERSETLDAQSTGQFGYTFPVPTCPAYSLDTRMLGVTLDSVHEVNRSNRPFPARIGSKLVIVYLMALLPPHTKHKFRLVYGGLKNDVGMMFEGFHNLYGTQPPVKTTSTSGS